MENIIPESNEVFIVALISAILFLLRCSIASYLLFWPRESGYSRQFQKLSLGLSSIMMILTLPIRQQCEVLEAQYIFMLIVYSRDQVISYRVEQQWIISDWDHYNHPHCESIINRPGSKLQLWPHLHNIVFHLIRRSWWNIRSPTIGIISNPVSHCPQTFGYTHLPCAFSNCADNHSWGRIGEIFTVYLQENSPWIGDQDIPSASVECMFLERSICIEFT